MKITKRQLRRIIKEELSRALKEQGDSPPRWSTGGEDPWQPTSTRWTGMPSRGERDEHPDRIERILYNAFPRLKKEGFVFEIDIQLPGEQYHVMSRGGLGELGRILGSGRGDWRVDELVANVLKKNGYDVDVGPDGLTAMVRQDTE